MKTIEERIKEARRYAGLSQTELANKLNITLRTIQRYEKDASKITVGNATNISHICQVNEIWLLTGFGERDMQINEVEDQVSTFLPQDSNLIEFEHMELVKKFKDKERGKLYNEQLIELEDLDNESFLDVGTYINATLNSVKRFIKKASKQSGRGAGKVERGKKGA